MSLTLTVGSNAPIALVQSSAIFKTTLPSVPGAYQGTLPAPSTQGTCLIAVVGIGLIVGGAGSVIFPDGWTRLAAINQGDISDLEVWAFPSNPGNIIGATVQPTSVSAPAFRIQLSEWSNVRGVDVVELSATATATSGTTLSPITTANVENGRELVISAWLQVMSVATAVTFTSPEGFTRLIDDGAGVTNSHLDIEYQLSPRQAATAHPTLTSTGTTAAAAGATLVLKAVSPATDLSGFLAY